MGPALEEGSQMGAVASAPQQQSNLRYVALARAQGCTVIGGETLGGERNFRMPVLFLAANTGIQVAQDEILVPVRWSSK